MLLCWFGSDSASVLIRSFRKRFGKAFKLELKQLPTFCPAPTPPRSKPYEPYDPYEPGPTFIDTCARQCMVITAAYYRISFANPN
jgi:hypothetical protein